MTISKTGRNGLFFLNNAIWAANSTVGYLALLKSGIFSVGVTADAGTDILTTASAHGLVSGTRVRITSSGSLPTGLSSSTDYYAGVLSATTLKMQSASGTDIGFSDNGTGTLTLQGQLLTTADPLAVLVNNEVAGNGYARQAIAVGSPAYNADPEKAVKLVSTTFTASGGTIAFRHTLVIHGGNSTAGNSTGNLGWLGTESADLTISSGYSRTISVELATQNA